LVEPDFIFRDLVDVRAKPQEGTFRLAGWAAKEIVRATKNAAAALDIERRRIELAVKTKLVCPHPRAPTAFERDSNSNNSNNNGTGACNRSTKSSRSSHHIGTSGSAKASRLPWWPHKIKITVEANSPAAGQPGGVAYAATTRSCLRSLVFHEVGHLADPLQPWAAILPPLVQTFCLTVAFIAASLACVVATLLLLCAVAAEQSVAFRVAPFVALYPAIGFSIWLGYHAVWAQLCIGLVDTLERRADRLAADALISRGELTTLALMLSSKARVRDGRRRHPCHMHQSARGELAYLKRHLALCHGLAVGMRWVPDGPNRPRRLAIAFSAVRRRTQSMGPTPGVPGKRHALRATAVRLAAGALQPKSRSMAPPRATVHIDNDKPGHARLRAIFGPFLCGRPAGTNTSLPLPWQALCPGARLRGCPVVHEAAPSLGFWRTVLGWAWHGPRCWPLWGQCDRFQPVAAKVKP
jgi:hypothetical protein